MSTAQSLREFKAGDTIMEQGEPAGSAYIIEEGRVEILVQKPDGQLQIVGTRGAGSMIGEMALVDKAPRTATIKAIEDCRLLEISEKDFENRLKEADPILRMTAQVILTRYRDTIKRAIIMKHSEPWEETEAQEVSYTLASEALDEIKISNEFKAALPNGDISLHYQPIIDLRSGYIAGFEALMRWEHPEEGFIPPNIFIPVIEDTGFIVEASKWALQESLNALNRIEEQGASQEEMFMSVNFSSRDFASKDFMDVIQLSIANSNVNPKLLHLEITERLLMDQPQSAQNTLELCRKEGIEISIDDFGTGYSSLSYLHHFPLDTLKIDRSFIKDMLVDDGVMALVKSIIGLSKNLELKIIAEGVEEAGHAKELKALGCEFAQGYYFAKPMPENELIDLLKSYKPFKI